MPLEWSVKRKSQADRRQETQGALLDATIECLVELGYSGTTTRIVASRAQVSRGAQTHYYATKSDLVVAAVEHLFDQLATQFRETFEAVDPTARTFDRAIEELWSLVSGPKYAAVLEVIVAARTDPELQVVVHGVAARLEQTVIEIVGLFFPDIAEPETARILINLAFTVVQGAAVSGYAGFGDPALTIAQLRALASVITPETARALASASASRRPADAVLDVAKTLGDGNVGTRTGRTGNHGSTGETDHTIDPDRSTPRERQQGDHQ